MKRVSRVGEKFEKCSFFSNLIFLPSGGKKKSFRKLLAGQTSAEDPGTHVAVPKISSELGVLLLVLAKCSFILASRQGKEVVGQNDPLERDIVGRSPCFPNLV